METPRSLISCQECTAGLSTAGEEGAELSREASREISRANVAPVLYCGLPQVLPLYGQVSTAPAAAVLRVWAYVWPPAVLERRRPCLHARRRGSVGDGREYVTRLLIAVAVPNNHESSETRMPHPTKRLHHELTWDSTMMDTKDCCLLTGTYMTHDRPPSK